MTTINSILIVCLMFSFEHVFGQLNITKVRNSAWPIDLVTPFPYPTYSPARVLTAYAKLHVTPTPLTFKLGALDQVVVQNTGYDIAGILNVPHGEVTVTGGILRHEVYEFDHYRFYWNNDPAGDSFATIDQKGSAVHALLTFFNRKYGNFLNAINFRDGLVTVSMQIDVQGYIPNPRFVPFEAALRTVKRTGAGFQTINQNAAPLSFFFAQAREIHYYYAYPGAYHTPVPEPKQMFVNTMIVFPKAICQSISIPQFTAFQHLRNIFNSPIDCKVPEYPLGDRPLVQVAGVDVKIHP